jgi:hypothetical protein
MPTISEITNLLGAIAGLGALIGVIILWRKSKYEIKITEASAAEQYEGLAERTLKKLNIEIENNQKLRADVNALKVEVDTLKTLVEDYDRGINLLISQLELNNYTPVWKPKKRAS